MNNDMKKTDAEKQLHKFRNQLHNLLIRNPEIRLAGDAAGDILAFIPGDDVHPHTGAYTLWTRVYLPRSGDQELISK